MIELEKRQPWLTDKKWILPVTVLLSVIVYFLLFKANAIVGRALSFSLLFIPFLLTLYFYNWRGGLEFIGVILLISGFFFFLDVRMNGKEEIFLRNLYLVVSILFMAVSLVIFLMYERVYLTENQQTLAEYKLDKDRLEELKANYKVISVSNKNLESAIEERSNLYEETKKMKSTFDLEKRMEIIKETLEKLFSFERGELIIQKNEDLVHPGFLSYFLYDLKEGIIKSDWEGWFNSAIKQQLVQKAEPILITEETVLRKFQFPLDISVFAGVPLISGGRVLGALTLENFFYQDKEETPFEECLEKLNVLAPQFSMELEIAKSYAKIQEMAIFDSLTQCFLRRHFMERLQEEISRSIRKNLFISLLMLDIDYFKDCNDKYGHLVGDFVLREVAQIIRDSVREVDLTARYGGEEFTILLPDTWKDGAYYVAERIRQAVTDYVFKAYDQEIKVTVSVGTATFPEDAYSAEDLVDKADQMLLKAKRLGRNRVCRFLPERKTDIGWKM